MKPVAKTDQNQAGEHKEKHIAADFAGQAMKEGFFNTLVETHRGTLIIVMLLLW
jgi:hypothetical protein